MEISTPSSDGIDTEKRSTSSVKVDDVAASSDELHGTAVADNGNVIDDGLQRGLKNRHLVRADSPRNNLRMVRGLTCSGIIANDRLWRRCRRLDMVWNSTQARVFKFLSWMCFSLPHALGVPLLVAVIFNTWILLGFSHRL